MIEFSKHSCTASSKPATTTAQTKNDMSRWGGVTGMGKYELLLHPPEANLNFPGAGPDLSPGCWGLAQLQWGDWISTLDSLHSVDRYRNASRYSFYFIYSIQLQLSSFSLSLLLHEPTPSPLPPPPKKKVRLLNQFIIPAAERQSTRGRRFVTRIINPNVPWRQVAWHAGPFEWSSSCWAG